jgi:hypothetical protein
MSVNWPPKTLEPFIDKGLIVMTTLVKVEAENSAYKGRDIVVYDAQTMEAIIRAYALAYAHGALRENQIHVGKQTSSLLSILVKTSLHTVIEEACGFTPQVPKTMVIKESSIVKAREDPRKLWRMISPTSVIFKK